MGATEWILTPNSALTVLSDSPREAHTKHERGEPNGRVRQIGSRRRVTAGCQSCGRSQVCHALARRESHGASWRLPVWVHATAKAGGSGSGLMPAMDRRGSVPAALVWVLFW